VILATDGNQQFRVQALACRFRNPATQTLPPHGLPAWGPRGWTLNFRRAMMLGRRFSGTYRSKMSDNSSGMKKQKHVLRLVGFLLVAYYSWLIFGSGDWFFTLGRNTPNRAALLEIREGIHIGDGYESALRSYWQHAAKDLNLYADSPKTWAVSMPFEIGATDWVLYVDFSDGKVSAMRVRTSNGPPPNEAPADVGG
jgi:hypothetical protein